MNDKSISDLVGNPNWHKIGLKEKIARYYFKQLKGSKNFDFTEILKLAKYSLKGISQKI